MKYEVSEKKLYPLDLKSVINVEGNLVHLETTIDFEKYSLEVLVSYFDKDDKVNNEMFIIPIDLNVTMTDNLEADLSSLKYNIKENEGIELVFTIDVNVYPIVDEKEEIKEIYQQELEAKINERDIIEIEEVKDEPPMGIEEEEVLIESNVNISTFKPNEDNILGHLKTDYIRYKIISLDEESLDKISLKYNLPINYLYELKKTKNKVMVYDRE